MDDEERELLADQLSDDEMEGESNDALALPDVRREVAWGPI